MIIEARYIFLEPWGRLPRERMNCVEMRRTQTYRRMRKMYLAAPPKGSTFGSARPPAMK
jgi:hypothetical protein